MKYEEIIKKIDFADKYNKEVAVAGNFNRTMTITMEEAFLFKQLLEAKVNGVETSAEQALNIADVTVPLQPRKEYYWPNPEMANGSGDFTHSSKLIALSIKTLGQIIQDSFQERNAR